jgi:hypothetical protein
MEQKLYLYSSKKKNKMDIQAEIKWIQIALSESKDPTFVRAVKSMITSMRKVKETLSSEQKREDALMKEAETDITAGSIYSIEQAHKIADSWEL